MLFPYMLNWHFKVLIFCLVYSKITVDPIGNRTDNNLRRQRNEPLDIPSQRKTKRPNAYYDSFMSLLSQAHNDLQVVKDVP